MSGAEAFCEMLSEMSFKGVESWGIDKLTLPTTYARYNNRLAKAFAREISKQGQKFSYLYDWGSEMFNASMKEIAENYQGVEITTEIDDQTMDD